jgi:TonB family protein
VQNQAEPKSTTTRSPARQRLARWQGRARLPLILVLLICPCWAKARAQESSAQITPPQVVQRVDAIYPPEAFAARQEATVTLLVTVGLDGSVTDVSVAESGGELFDKAAIEAVRQWKFIPARRGDQPVVSRIRIPFRFALPAVGTPPVPQAPPASPAVTPAPPKPDSAGAPSRESAGAAATEAEQEAGGEQPIDVTVRGRARTPTRGTSDFQIEVGALAVVPRQNASEMLKLAPGILLTNEGGEAHAEQVFLRGFDAREGQDIEFTAGGVPINEAGNLHGNGYADTHFIIPELVSSLRILEGPFDPRQGNFAVAGSADFELGLPRRGFTTKFTAGSYGTTRTLFLWGPPGASEATFGGVELYQTDGFGQNRDGRRASLMAQYEGHSGQHTYRLGVSAYIAGFHSAGILREDDYRSGRVGFFDSYDTLTNYGTTQGEDTSRYSLWGELESHFGRVLLRNQVFGIARPMRLRENFTGFLLDQQQPFQFPHAQRGDFIDLESTEGTVGARGSARISERFFNQPQELEIGYFGRGDFVNSSQRRIQVGTRAPYHLDTDLESKLGDIGLFADLNLRGTSWLSVRGGVRADFFTYDVLDKCAVHSVAHPSRLNPPGDQSCLSQQDFGAYREPVQRATASGGVYLPRVSLVLGPFWGFGASAGYGRGVRSIDPIYVSQDAKTPFASADATEAGLIFNRRFGSFDFGARSTVFQTRVDRDLIFSETTGRNVLCGGTTRTGVANAVRLTGNFLDLAANFTYVKATFNDDSSVCRTDAGTSVSGAGLLIPYIPDRVFRLDGTVFGDLPFERLRLGGRPVRGALATGITYVSPRPLPQNERGNTIFTVDLNATLGWSFVELGVIFTNLFDARYRLGEYNFTSDFHSQSQSIPTLVPVRHFSAGAPRAVFFTLALNFGGAR